ncbi:uncharacterized protein Z520_08188 [Fonsecaea multimorphosa CBS 102226]|uniref:Ribosome biogenesis protein SLX9 n=1 Tax=Fonsecaea multimorphosa CBS 102226 TaxID=1442371 RepID=A0A0D2KH24_9EURO|nr:uncharacterized protein Z520_08188 [Fonsecaea multimorphosa CBS 102226]KIX95933.1 hypothetical protein Z520_08188 [Fonsecaea multimorphosa CBS 102226]OAL21704.1 hypothetical protein AYO22_07646 [Fonsecaea multimorphosa]
MAPVRNPPSQSVRPLKSILKQTSKTAGSTATPKSEPLFPSSKKDKRRIKHAELMNKVTKSAAKKSRRRRPNKKLVTNLDALAAALPDDDELENNGAHGTTAPTSDQIQDQVNIIRRKSMKSRPGALKRREKVDKGERDRFAKNMAQLAVSRSVNEGSADESGNAAGGGGTTAAISSTSERWAALRGFISQTLETRPDLKITT